jgi:hypothetical protein
VSDADIATNDASIVDRVYAHITRWLANNSHPAQIIIVGHEPSAAVPYQPSPFATAAPPEQPHTV